MTTDSPTMAQTLDSFPDKGTRRALINLMFGDPAVRANVKNALQSTVDFYKRGRGAMLRSLRQEPIKNV